MKDLGLRPSAAHRWIHCTASVQHNPESEDESSEYAAEGTAAHKLASRCADMFEDPEAFLGTFVEGYEVTREMANAVNFYFDYIAGWIKDMENPYQYVEVEVKLESLTGRNGTADWVLFGFINETFHIHIFDLKYGKGVIVDAYQNEQELLYAWGALKKFVPNLTQCQIHLHIIQPRRNHTSHWELSRKELTAFNLKKVSIAVTAINLNNVTYVPGEKQCRFCAYRKECPALAEYSYKALTAEFDDLTQERGPRFTQGFKPKDLTQLSDNELGHVVEAAPLIRKWLDGAVELAQSKLEQGHALPGVKLVASLGNRQWHSEEKTVLWLAQRGYRPSQILSSTLLSPTQMEKVVSKEDYEELKQQVIRTSKSVIAPVSDKRKAITLHNDELDKQLFGDE